jgi:hypothetical protein
MPQGNPTAMVYIWYPHSDQDGDLHIGHASMYIGNYEVGRNFELSLHNQSADYMGANRAEQQNQALGKGFQGVYYNDNYVSWWPTGGSAGPHNRRQANPALGLWEDVASERGQPHVTYRLYGLNVGTMRACWQKTRDKQGAGYQLLRKSCATIVAKVLEAGGILNKIGTANSLWYGHHAFWTPKHIAQVCNLMCEKDLGEKIKWNCPGKNDEWFSPLAVGLGMR